MRFSSETAMRTPWCEEEGEEEAAAAAAEEETEEEEELVGASPASLSLEARHRTTLRWSGRRKRHPSWFVPAHHAISRGSLKGAIEEKCRL